MAEGGINLSRIEDKMASCLLALEEMKIGLARARDDIAVQAHRLRDETNKRKEELLKLIDEHHEALLNQISSLEEDELNECDDQWIRIDEQLTECNRKQERGAGEDNTARAQKALLKKVGNVKRNYDDFISRSPEFKTIELKDSNLQEFLREGGENIIGVLEEKGPHLVKTIQSADTVLQQKPIRGLTILGRELLIVRENSDNVEVYEGNEYQYERTLTIPNLYHPYDILACNLRAYILSSELDIEENSRRSLKEITGQNNQIIRQWGTAFGLLSVVDDSHILLTAVHKNSLCVFDVTAIEGEEKTDEIPLSKKETSLTEPWHAVNLAKDHPIVKKNQKKNERNGESVRYFLLSYGSRPHRIHGVCLLKYDEDGDPKYTILCHYRDLGTHEILNVPKHLAVDDSGYVFVCDSANSRVLLLNSRLELTKVLLSRKDGLRLPERLYLDGQTRRLFVVDNQSGHKDGRVLVFQLDQFPPIE